MTSKMKPGKRLSVSDFRKCFPTLVDDLPAGGVIITKRGRPVAKLSSLRHGEVDNRPLFGALKGVLSASGDIFSTGDRWNAES